MAPLTRRSVSGKDCGLWRPKHSLTSSLGPIRSRQSWIWAAATYWKASPPKDGSGKAWKTPSSTDGTVSSGSPELRETFASAPTVIRNCTAWIWRYTTTMWESFWTDMENRWPGSSLTWLAKSSSGSMLIICLRVSRLLTLCSRRSSSPTPAATQSLYSITIRASPEM